VTFGYVCDKHQPAVLFHDFRGTQAVLLSIDIDCGECHHAGRQELGVELAELQRARDALAAEKREAARERQAGAS
jgi:hypothetical protein